MRFRSPSRLRLSGTRQIFSPKPKICCAGRKKRKTVKPARPASSHSQRQAAQTAEDARIVAIQRRQNGKLANAKEQAARAEAMRAQAEAAAQTAQSQAAAADRALLEQECAARQQAEAQAAAAVVAETAHQAPQTPVQTRPAPGRDEPQKKELRLLLLEQFNAVLSARDALTLTMPDSDFEGARVRVAVCERLARVASVLRAHPDLTVEVDGHERFSSERAEAVRDLVSHGLRAGAVLARGMGRCPAALPPIPASRAVSRIAGLRSRSTAIRSAACPTGPSATAWRHRRGAYTAYAG
jgi:outer membrane protein OmpA-like peptidoglycan-associated protein